jgi:glycosyltransferase involved in cell wall biosynthesis
MEHSFMVKSNYPICCAVILPLIGNHKSRVHVAKTRLVSIIIPAYNAAPFLVETIQSLCNQTYTHWEAIIVNDGSTDNTATICDSFIDKRVSTIHQSNTGVATARNNGLALAKGDYIVFFDADDLMAPDFCRQEYRCWKKIPIWAMPADWWKLFRLKKTKTCCSRP